jgi:hypothetical protein
MQIKNNIEIISIEEIDPSTLHLSFNLQWTMDDKAAVIDHILLSVSAKVLEVLQGADLYCLRIKYNDYEFLLNFEEYSHACWIECIAAQGRAGLQEIKRLLSLEPY